RVLSRSTRQRSGHAPLEVALDLGDRGQDPGLGVRLLLARCRIPVRDHLPDLLAPEGVLLVRRELDAEAFVKQALGVLAARSLVGRHTHTQGIHECPVAATQKMIICLYPFCDARVWPGRLVDPSSGDRCEGKEDAYEGGLRRFSQTCALAQACLCEVRT